jgi:hypothetical protein
MEVFSNEISDFQKNGTYDYVFDEGGNLIFNQSSSKFNQTFLSIPLANYAYDNVKISSFYNLEFTEFSPTSKNVVVVASSTTEMDELTSENLELKNKLIELSQLSDANITEAERQAIKQIIIDLRIQLKQGVAERDFSETFPYLPSMKNR